MISKVAWGIVGTGWMAQRFAQTLNALDEARIVAVCSGDGARAENFRSLYGIEKAYDDESDLVNDSRVDVVYIATPHPRHFATAMLALGAGKPVLCEKPFAMSAAEARAIADLAKEKGLFCMEAMWTRFLPLYRNLKTVIAEAGLGAPVYLRSELGRPVAFDPNGRFFNAALGGGSLLDMGVYCISVATHLFGAPTEVHSVASLGTTGVDEQCSIFLKYPQGMASLSSSFRCDLVNDVQVFCADGGFRIAPVFIESEKLELWRLSTDIPPTVPAMAATNRKREGSSIRSTLRKYLHGGQDKSIPPPMISTLEFPAVANRHAYQALETMRCLREGLTESPILPLAESVLVMDVIDRVRESWRCSWSGGIAPAV